jgi:hypothetical protein
MKPLIREYLASLKERDELDAILPDLLSELGYTVFLRPARGIPQYGVDVGALAPPTDGRVYLFSIKRGDLTRSDWDNPSPQALRPSLNEIKDVYIPTHLPPEYQDRKVVICPSFGGDIHQSVQLTISSYMEANSTDKITFETWNGDRIAGYIEEGYLNDGLLSGKMRSDLRKAIALLDEPEASFAHFSSLTRSLVDNAEDKSPAARITIARQICISLWMLFVWGRDVGNLESPYLSSELALLHTWHALRSMLAVPGKPAETAGEVLQHLLDLHFQIWDELVGGKILPHCGELHAVSAAVWSQSPLDVNLKLFEMLGRLALRGLWLLWAEPVSDALPAPCSGPLLQSRMRTIVERVVALIAANSTLLSPIRDDHAIELTLAFMLLSALEGNAEAIRDCLREISARYEHTYTMHKRYPCIFKDYRDLADHPKPTEEYRAGATAGSALLPTLALWASGTANFEALKILANFKRERLQHCTTQLWIPDDTSEKHLCLDDSSHGAAFTEIPITEDGRATLDYVLRECSLQSSFFGLSVIDEFFWPLLLVACRHYRLPVPPHMIMRFLPELEFAVDQQPPIFFGMELPRANRENLLCTTAITEFA